MHVIIHTHQLWLSQPHTQPLTITLPLQRTVHTPNTMHDTTHQHIRKSGRMTQPKTLKETHQNDMRTHDTWENMYKTIPKTLKGTCTQPNMHTTHNRKHSKKNTLNSQSLGSVAHHANHTKTTCFRVTSHQNSRKSSLGAPFHPLFTKKK